MSAIRSSTIVAGVDVGGAKKGFHAVALSGNAVVATSNSVDPLVVARWCLGVGAAIIGVDSPISWSATGRARSAERALMQQGVWCFSTPTEKAAKAHPRNHFGWMLQGAKLYHALDKSSVRFDGSNERLRPICFETFPHAIACALNGAPVSASNKRKARCALLSKAGVSCDSLTNIDFVDAALCALTAAHFARGQFEKHGDPGEGFIVVPR